ncbi:MAG: hypothetical protein M0R32_12175 [Candidatus Cloacimonetes bacterium]|jgi:hypothetical protein|nr:hypothetical protein [Candidatus Cloacimonadota bacterium]
MKPNQLNERTEARIGYQPEMIDGLDYCVFSKENPHIARFKTEEEAKIFTDGYNRQLEATHASVDRRAFVDGPLEPPGSYWTTGLLRYNEPCPICGRIPDKLEK